MRITSHGFITKATKVIRITKAVVIFVFFVGFVYKPWAVTAP